MLAAGLVLFAAFAVLSAISPGRSAGGLDASHAVVLGLVEGITEFLPVSSTGHLVVTERLFGLGATRSALEALDSYAVIIQGGAILGVAWLFWGRLAGAALALGGMLRVPGFRRPVTVADRRWRLPSLSPSHPPGSSVFSPVTP